MTGVDELDERRLQSIAEQALGLRWQIVSTAAIVAVVVWHEVPALALIGWLTAVIASREVRASALKRMSKAHDTPIAQRLRATTRWNLLLGACNGSAALFLTSLDTTLGAVLTMIIVSWGAGAVATSATFMPAFLAYAGLMFVPLAGMWLLSATWLGVGIAALVLMFFVVQWRFARRNLQMFEESFEIRRENEALARNLVVERAALRQARDAAVQADREKSRFLAAASHDLRQPLQAIALNSGEMVRLPLDAHGKAVAEDIRLGIDQLRTMLDALLDVSKLDSGGMTAQPQGVRLDVLVGGIVAGFKAAATARGLQLGCDCPADVAVRADPDLLHRIVANLLDNAIKFTPSGSVDLAVTKVDEQHAEIVVRDNGPGIAAEHHGLIFEDLVQLHGNDPTAPLGHGLGLGIVRRAAALSGLRVTLHSAPGQGATFRLRLPLADSGPVAEPERVVSVDLHDLRVLVLDDDAMVRGAYVNALIGSGAAPLAAATIEEAMAHADACDAAIVDWRLGGDADGFQAIDRLHEQRPGLPVVMVTGDMAESIAETARRRRIPLLRKPVDMATLGAVLGAAVVEATPSA